MSASPARHLLAALLAAAVLPLAAGACGGEDTEQQITDALNAGLTSDDPKVACEQLPSSELVAKIWGTVENCLKIERKDEDEPAQAVEVSGIEVDGESATAFIERKGGTNDGARGALDLVKEDGEWRIDDLSPALLRSQFETGVRSDRELPTALKECLSEKVLALDDAELKTFAYASIGEKPEARRQLARYLSECAGSADDGTDSDGKDSGEVSILRRQFEKGIAESLRKDGASAAVIACVQRELRSSISDDDIIGAIGKTGDDVPPELASKAAAALAECDASQ